MTNGWVDVIKREHAAADRYIKNTKIAPARGVMWSQARYRRAGRVIFFISIVCKASYFIFISYPIYPLRWIPCFVGKEQNRFLWEYGMVWQPMFLVVNSKQASVSYRGRCIVDVYDLRRYNYCSSECEEDNVAARSRKEGFGQFNNVY